LDNDFVSKKDHELWLRIGLAGRIDYLPVLLAHARVTPGYLADRGDITAAACVALTRKFFRLSDIPTGLRSKRRRALSNAYLRGMEYAFEGGRFWGVVSRYILGAVLADPANVVNGAQRLRRLVTQGAIEDPRLRLPRRILDALAGLHSRLRGREPGRPRVPNLLGDREIEWSWVAATMPAGPGEALDFGAGESPLGPLAALRGFRVTSVDLQEIWRPYRVPEIRFLRGDILKLPLPDASFDLVINCSTVEHVGLPGRYGVVEERPDGDLEAMARLWALLKPGGAMLLTVPVGLDAVFSPLTRVYGKARLPRLLDRYLLEREHYWVKDNENRWVPCDRTAALRFESSAGSWDPLRNVYALGAFVLRRP
jgi:SAM-dependent methyltransferase